MSEKNCSNGLYPAAELYLDLLKSEYSFQENRMKGIDSKAGILLTIVVIIIPFYLSSFDVNRQEIYAWQLAEWTLCISILLAFISLLFLMFSVSSYKYNRLDSKILAKVELHQMQREVAASAVCEALNEKILFNRKTNNKKIRNFRLGITLLVVSLLAFSLSRISTYMYSSNIKEENVMDEQESKPKDQTQQLEVSKRDTLTREEAVNLLRSPCIETFTLHKPNKRKNSEQHALANQIEKTDKEKNG